jgi:hypothetical protein
MTRLRPEVAADRAVLAARIRTSWVSSPSTGYIHWQETRRTRPVDPAPEPAVGSLQNMFPLQTVGYGIGWRRRSYYAEPKGAELWCA